MIVSINTYYIVCGIIVFLFAIPALYSRFIKKSGSKMDFIIFLGIVLLVPINWFTPAVFNVTSCDEYTKEIVLLPNSEYSLGRHNYIINNSSSALYLEYIVYGRVNPNEVEEDIVIKQGETYKAPFIHLDYPLEAAPSSVRMKGDGMVKTRLSCISE